MADYRRDPQHQLQSWQFFSFLTRPPNPPLENIAIVIDLSLEKEPDLVTFITLSLKVRLAIKILNYHQD